MMPRKLPFFGLALFSLFAAAAPQAGAAAPPRWTDETADLMLEAAKARVTLGDERQAIAGLLEIAALAHRASFGSAKAAFDQIASDAHVSAEVREEAALQARMLDPNEGSAEGAAADRAHGILTELAILGPFRDTGGGLTRKEGPEEKGSSFADMKARYSWGTVDVAWRAVPRAFATARGLPLDVFVHPRKESCTLVASEIMLYKAQAIVVRLAATGQARLSFDGADLGHSEDVHTSLHMDRLASKIDATAGPHLVVAKVCTGALPDDGRVRLRVTDDKGAPLAVASTAELMQPPSKANVKASVATTPLGRALGLPAKPDVDAQLAAATARTLGGADDAKSPRVGGLLDSITSRKDLDPDRLAMAGWIAPSGANRSGWLNLARERAVQTNDAKSKAFASRRLVAEHLSSQLYDWAMAASRAAKLDEAKDAEATLIGASIEYALGSDSLRTHAMRGLAASFAAAKNKVPTALVEELARQAGAYDRALAREAQLELARRGFHGSAEVEAETARDAKAVVEAAKAAFEGNVDDVDEALQVARAVARAGAHDQARALFTKLVEWAPNRAETWAGLAEQIAAVGGPGADQATTAALRRSRELAPGDARYRAELVLRSPSGTRSEARDDEKYIVPSQTLLARRQGVPAGAPTVADRELHWLRAVVMHPDARVSQLIHYAREIVVPPRTQGELFEDIPAEGDLTEILRARVHRRDGGTAFPTEEHNEGTRPRIRWPELQAGDVVEVAIRTWTSTAIGGRGDAPFYFMDYAGATSTHPLLYNEVIVESLPTRPLYVDVLNGGAYKKVERDENGKKITQLVWDKPAIVPEEPLAPSLSEIVPVIVGSTFKTWQDFRKWYAEAIKGFTEPDDQVRRIAADLTKGKTTREAKLKALFDFVADDIRYVNYVSGEWWLPNRPQQLLARREGDCDDKAILLITLLRAIGIEAQEVMVQTRLTAQPSIVQAKNIAVPLFDHGIAFLPGPNGGTYLDATSPQSRLGPLPSMDARAVALRMDAGPAEIVTLPASSPEDHGSDVTWTITLQASGAGELSGEEKHVGDGAFWLRTYLTQPDARAQYVEDNLLGGWFSTMEVDKKIDFSGDLPQGQATVKYKARSDGMARREQNELVLPLSPSQTLASQIAPLTQRTLPVLLPPNMAPSHQSRTIRVVAPAGFRFAPLPSGGDENGGEFGRAHLELALDATGRTATVKRSVVFNQHLVSVDKYQAWRQWLLRVDALMHKGVRLVPEEGVAKRGAR
jgi:hypothetical protein